jgi:hypothetical protein
LIAESGALFGRDGGAMLAEARAKLAADDVLL